MSITDIKCAEDITELERDAIEDILHSNFVPFKSTQDFGELANELFRLWKETQQQDLECKNPLQIVVLGMLIIQ